MFASFLDILQFPHDPNLTINVLLSFYFCFLRNLPTSKIKQLKPNYKNILEKIEAIKKQISTISYMFESSETHLWWKAFLEKLNTVMPMRTKEDIIWITRLLKQQKNNNKETLKTTWIQYLERCWKRKQVDLTCVINPVKEDDRNLKTSRGKQKLKKKTERIQGGRSGVNCQSTVVQVNRKKLNQQHQQCQRERQTGRRIMRWKSSRWITILTDDERKRHIWLIILFELLGHLLLYIIYVFIMTRCIKELFIMMDRVWKAILLAHMGQFLCFLTVNTYLEHFCFVFCNVNKSFPGSLLVSYPFRHSLSITQ
ncbi:uncharacterized protein LOC123551982 isoform X1 [Mercenaria mercenaria]|uniref:uncharacterized protein LOC123551982 isoform X1 n=1 Tax=Mercenaria mercenaria TaxID=6596 RepID=UPI00234E85AD|nr:uncharacterized protein LOC123551982 isoform X1 [Mercenaria mercenaria]